MHAFCHLCKTGLYYILFQVSRATEDILELAKAVLFTQNSNLDTIPIISWLLHFDSVGG